MPGNACEITAARATAAHQQCGALRTAVGLDHAVRDVPLGGVLLEGDSPLATRGKRGRTPCVDCKRALGDE